MHSKYFQIISTVVTQSAIIHGCYAARERERETNIGDNINHQSETDFTIVKFNKDFLL